MRDGEDRILKKVHPSTYNAVLDDGEGVTYEYDSDGNNIHYPDGCCECMFYDVAGRTSYRKYTPNGQFQDLLQPM